MKLNLKSMIIGIGAILVIGMLIFGITIVITNYLTSEGAYQIAFNAVMILIGVAIVYFLASISLSLAKIAGKKSKNNNDENIE